LSVDHGREKSLRTFSPKCLDQALHGRKFLRDRFHLPFRSLSAQLSSWTFSVKSHLAHFHGRMLGRGRRRIAFLLFSAKMKFFDVLGEKPSRPLSWPKIPAGSQPNAGFIAFSAERSCAFFVKSPSGSVH
jgi:hypothetical protein